MSLVTLNKLKRFYNKCKLIWDSLDEKMEETETIVTDINTNITTIEEDYNNRFRLISNILGLKTTILGFVTSISYTGYSNGTHLPIYIDGSLYNDPSAIGKYIIIENNLKISYNNRIIAAGIYEIIDTLDGYVTAGPPNGNIPNENYLKKVNTNIDNLEFISESILGKAFTATALSMDNKYGFNDILIDKSGSIISNYDGFSTAIGNCIFVPYTIPYSSNNDKKLTAGIYEIIGGKYYAGTTFIAADNIKRIDGLLSLSKKIPEESLTIEITSECENNFSCNHTYSEIWNALTEGRISNVIYRDTGDKIYIQNGTIGVDSNDTVINFIFTWYRYGNRMYCINIEMDKDGKFTDIINGYDNDM